MGLFTEGLVSEDDFDALRRERNELMRKYDEVVQTLFAFQDINKIDHDEVMWEINRLLEADWRYKELQD